MPTRQPSTANIARKRSAPDGGASGFGEATAGKEAPRAGGAKAPTLRQVARHAIHARPGNAMTPVTRVAVIAAPAADPSSHCRVRNAYAAVTSARKKRLSE